MAYKYGVSGPFWYAAGATIQIILFGILAIEIKRKAPTAHTVLEIISAPPARPGPGACKLGHDCQMLDKTAGASNYAWTARTWHKYLLAFCGTPGDPYNVSAAGVRRLHEVYGIVPAQH